MSHECCVLSNASRITGDWGLIAYASRSLTGVYSSGQRPGGHVHTFLLDDGSGLTLIQLRGGLRLRK
jgi:hypothetical protein